MNRRDFLRAMPPVAVTLAMSSHALAAEHAGKTQVMTVRGRIDAREMGVTLTHEHALANFQPYSERATKPRRYDHDEVVSVVLPYLNRLRELGCRTFVDATAAVLGRDPLLLRRLSEESGLHILTVTGNYAAADYQFLPDSAYSDSVEALAKRWIGEWNEGIEGTDVYPGFIKLGFNGKALSEVEQKLIRAGAITHLRTGLTIGAHTGQAIAAFEQLAILEAAGVHPSAWIWIHAQNEQDLEQHVKAARRGAWISFDGVAPDSFEAHVRMTKRLRDEGLLGRVLVSQDAGWYTVGEPRGGEFRTYETLFTQFIPALRKAGFSDAEVNTVLVDNPAKAFAIEVRRARA